ncbi:hypothetical protein [Haliangium sp. UPWRP_2]|uniref:hypothetical protein n=1 Tax=Haliangium sp. UPWRP_2 TaxID=1931276 RepID=UPI000B53A9EE|nr:hypothetical protein [Haliangium sp. UPWRP_2]PSM31478.1 hypothetical protein BVG81_005195 [Haliangium sp. UPWRP_2]
MCFYARHASSSRRRLLRRRQAPPMPPLALLDLSKPGERQAHDFLVRATSGRDRMWELKTLRRRGDVLLCVVRWVHLDKPALRFSLAEVSLTETAIRWQYYSSAEAARANLE